MANTILLKKNGTASAVPASLSFGELALNYADGKLYYKNADTTIKAINTGGGITYTRYTSNVTATDKQGIIADTSGGQFTVTLPATPATGTQVVVVDGANWGTNNLVIARNGSTIEGLAEDMLLDISGASVTFIYDGVTWEIYSQVGAAGGTNTIVYARYTANATALDKQGIIADTSGGSFTITLPATPNIGSQVVVVDGAAWGTNNLTIARNGSTIEGLAEDMILDISGAAVTFIYDGTTWEAYSQIGAAGGSAGYRNLPPVGTKTSNYTLGTTDVGKYVQVAAGGSITIPDAVFAEGDIVWVFNNTSSAITITCSITTAYISGIDTDKATVSLATRGVATILFISGTICVISGSVS